MNRRMLYNTLLPLGAVLLILILVMIFVLNASAPSVPEPTAETTVPTTAAPTETTEPPAAPPPPPNIYSAADFAEDESGYLTCLTAQSMVGVDVSEHQGEIDWQAVAGAGIDFAIIRVGFRGYGETGKMVEDENAKTNIQNALDAGLKVGVYFFSQATSPREAISEAQMTLNVIQGFPIEMPVVFDWEYVGDYARTAETDAETVTACAQAFCNTIALAGYQPMFYSNQNLSESHFDLNALSDYPMWLAMYDTRMTYPHRLFMWQYTSDGTVPGIEGTVDLNLYLPENMDFS